MALQLIYSQINLKFLKSCSVNIFSGKEHTMADFLESQSTRGKRLTLYHLQETCQNVEFTQAKKGKFDKTLYQSNKVLEKLIKDIKVNKLSSYVKQKLLLNNIFGKRTDFSIMSEKQYDEQRRIQMQGFRINEKILATIYFLEIIFMLVTFVLSSFVAFLEGFRNLEYHRQSSMLILNLLAIGFSISKIVTSVITKKIKDGIQLVYISDIFYDYVSSFVIFIDFAYLIMLIVFLVDGNNSIGFGVSLFLMCLIKLISSFNNFVAFETTFIKGFKNELYWKLIKTIVFNVAFAHFLASMLLAMAKLNEEENWLIAHSIQNSDWNVQYMWAYYWATTVMMTIGFGDISATNHQEGIVLAFLELFSCIVLAYNISEIGSIISALRSAQNQYQKKISIFKRMAQQDEIDVQLKTKIEGYLREQRQINQSYEFNQQSQLLGSIPQNLRKQYIVQSNKKFFTYLPFFRNIRKTTLMKFTADFTGRVYYPGQFLLSLNDCEQNIIILKQGKVGLSYKKRGSKLNGTIVQSIQIQQKLVHVQDDIFQKRLIPIMLNTNFLNRSHKTNYEVSAQTYSFAYSLSYESFLASIKESDVDSSYYFSILHRTSISKNEWMQVQCQKCSQQSQISVDLDVKNVLNFNLKRIRDIKQEENRKQYHTNFQCPKLHFCPLKGIAILKTLKSRGNLQPGKQNYARKRQRQGHSYLLRTTIFSPFQQKININTKKRLETMIVKDKQQRQSKVTTLKQIKTSELGSFSLDSSEQVQLMEKLIKKSLQQVMKGYEEGFWDLEIDSMMNYLSYFPLDNPRNFDYLPLKREYSQNSLSFSGLKKVALITQQSEQEKFLVNNPSLYNMDAQYRPRTKQVRILRSQQSEQSKSRYFKRIDNKSERVINQDRINVDYYRKSNLCSDQGFSGNDEVIEDEFDDKDHSVISSKSHHVLYKKPNNDRI